MLITLQFYSIRSSRPAFIVRIAFKTSTRSHFNVLLKSWHRRISIAKVIPKCKHPSCHPTKCKQTQARRVSKYILRIMYKSTLRRCYHKPTPQPLYPSSDPGLTIMLSSLAKLSRKKKHSLGFKFSSSCVASRRVASPPSYRILRSLITIKLNRLFIANNVKKIESCL